MMRIGIILASTIAFSSAAVGQSLSATDIHPSGVGSRRAVRFLISAWNDAKVFRHGIPTGSPRSVDTGQCYAFATEGLLPF